MTGSAEMGNDIAEDEVPMHKMSGAPDHILNGVALLCRLNNRDLSEEALKTGLPLVDGKLTLELVPRAMRRAGLQGHVTTATLGDIHKDLLPVLIVLEDGSTCAVTDRIEDDFRIIRPELDEHTVTYSHDELAALFGGTVIYAGARDVIDGRADDITVPDQGHWLWRNVRANSAGFTEVGLAAALANLLAVVSALFAMQVYDRVIPNFAFSTLWVLAIGVCVAIVFEAMLRTVRSHLMDKIGRSIDMRISAELFEHVMNVQCAARPRSNGAFINQVREVEAVREFFTSTTIGAISDLPFVLLFLFVMWTIGGPLALVLMIAIPVIIGAGFLAQVPLAKLSKNHHKEASIRNGILIEAISNPETVKAYQGEAGFQRLWEEYNQLLVKNSIKQRSLGSSLTYLATSVQQLSYVFVIVAGVYLVQAGSISVGGLIAASILSSRTIAPLGQLSAIFARWQQMKTSLTGLNKVMQLPVDRPRGRQFVSRPALEGAYEFVETKFTYGKDEATVLDIPKLEIEGGDAVALLGNNGAGKSTILKLMSGLYFPSSGNLNLDGTDIRQIDPSDIRRQIGYFPQEISLFFGTLRSNLSFGLGHVSDDEMLAALKFAGAENLVRRHAKGLDRPIGEGGKGLSGGQRQSVGLARLWLRDPRIVLMDEPTAAMDQATETKVINNMEKWLAGRTLIVATHRQPILRLVNKALVMRGGKVTAYGPRDEILSKHTGNKRTRTTPRGDAAPQLATPVGTTE